RSTVASWMAASASALRGRPLAAVAASLILLVRHSETTPFRFVTISWRMAIPNRALGGEGLTVAAQGLGCMGMSEFYGAGDRNESVATIHRALELGVNFLDTADVYGPHTNEELVGSAIRTKRDEVVLATKFGIVRDPDDPRRRGINGRPDYVHSAIDGSLQRLGLDHVDLYYQHRVDPTVPIEETVGAMAELVQAGKVRFQSENCAKNLGLVEAVRAMAEEKGVTAGQLALAWVHAQGADVFPIPGTKRRTYLEENVAAVDISLSDGDLARLDEILPPGAA